jgi:hypothetical protein
VKVLRITLSANDIKVNKYFSNMKATAAAAADSYDNQQLQQMHEARIDRYIKVIDGYIESAKKGGTSWERNAVKRVVQAELQPFVAGKKFGFEAKVKIAIQKAETFQQIKDILEKYRSVSVT